jgi:hypothetical protein
MRDQLIGTEIGTDLILDVNAATDDDAINN